jgi:Zn-dependent M32 family carboxypeptidase
LSISYFGRTLNVIESQSYQGLNEYETVNVKLIRKDYEQATKVSKELVQEESKLKTEAFEAWVSA